MKLSLYLAAGVATAMAITLEAGQIVRKTIQQQAAQSDFIVAADVREVRAMGIRDPKFKLDRWEADCVLRDVICGAETNRAVKIAFFMKPSIRKTSLPPAEGLEPGKAYVLFLRHDKSGLSLIEPWDSRLEIGARHEVWDEDFRNDPEMLKQSTSVINGVPLVPLTHDVLIQKIRTSWEKEKQKAHIKRD